jgi:hypothetical protein
VIQYPSRLSLDLDIVTYVLPVENGRLLLNNVGGVIGSPVVAMLFHHRLHTIAGSFFVVRNGLRKRCWLPSTAEDENFALRLFGGDVLGGEQIGEHEKDQKADDDAQVPIIMARQKSIAESFHLESYVPPFV